MTRPLVRPGLDLLISEQSRLLMGQRVGLLTHAAGVTSDLVPALNVISAIPTADLRLLFAPEHGIKSNIGDALNVPDSFDEGHAVPVFSLYGTREFPTAAILDEVDVVVCDLVDVGARFYTYVTTLHHLMRECGRAGKRVVVCDRPNPIGGQEIEGPIAKQHLFSEFAAGPLPIRHGLTIGELSQLYVRHWDIDCEVDVLPCEGWKRSMFFADTGLTWNSPSPAMPSPRTADVYPGFCLFEGTNMSEGRGTLSPFEQIGAPWLSAEEVLTRVQHIGLDGASLRPTSFTPVEGKWSGVHCNGIKIEILDRGIFRPVETAIRVLTAVRTLHPDTFAWELPHFDLLAGSESLREGIDARAPIEELMASWQDELTIFDAERRGVFLYR